LRDSIVATVYTYGVSVSKDSSIYKGKAIFLMASGAQSYIWRPFIGLSDSTGETVLANPNESICYVVYGTSANGCVGTDTVCVTVMDPYSIKLPNIISPDGDDLNDVWRIDMLPEWFKYEVTIMDRQGAIVFKRSPYDNSFDATDLNGVPLPNGVYYYYLRHLGLDIKFKGYIQVIR
jgi:gliding motility-associated-like protein